MGEEADVSGHGLELVVCQVQGGEHDQLAQTFSQLFQGTIADSWRDTISTLGPFAIAGDCCPPVSEVSDDINKLGNNKAVGGDILPAEVLRAGGAPWQS